MMRCGHVPALCRVGGAAFWRVVWCGAVVVSPLVAASPVPQSLDATKSDKQSTVSAGAAGKQDQGNSAAKTGGEDDAVSVSSGEGEEDAEESDHDKNNSQCSICRVSDQ